MPLGKPGPFDPMLAIFSDGMIEAVPQVCVRDVVGPDRSVGSVGSVAVDQRVPRGADFAARQAVADDPRAEQEFKAASARCSSRASTDHRKARPKSREVTF
jgi:hypothetical protein